jgi:hypothetical protein
VLVERPDRLHLGRRDVQGLAGEHREHLVGLAPVSGGDKYPILPFTGEISYPCFTGSQKYFRGPVKSP